MKKKKVVQQNFVAKHQHVHRASTHRDKKNDYKRPTNLNKVNPQDYEDLILSTV